MRRGKTETPHGGRTRRAGRGEWLATAWDSRRERSRAGHELSSVSQSERGMFPGAVEEEGEWHLLPLDAEHDSRANQFVKLISWRKAPSSAQIT